MAVRSVLVAFVTTGWNSWMRDLVPQTTLGAYFSRRLGVSTLTAVGFGLAAAFAVDTWGTRADPEEVIYGYSAVLAFGAVTLGFASVVLTGLVPEPRMAPPQQPASLTESLGAPFRDPSFKHLIRFLVLWSFASSLAIPFFTVYMLVRLEFALPLVIGLMALSQIVTAVFTGTWGTLADRYGFKAVLSLSGSLYLFVIAGWSFTAAPDPHFLTLPLVVGLLVFAGIAAAGVNLAVEVIGLKLAPEGRSTPYLVAASLAASVGAALGPMVGGSLADFFSQREISMVIGWTDPDAAFEWLVVYLTGFDFLFAIAFLIGLPTLVLLRRVHEQGEVSHDVVLDELFAQGQGLSRAISLVPGLMLAASIPYTYLRRVPGVNVGVGATLFEVRAAVRGAVKGLRGSNRLTAQLTRRLDARLRRLLARESMDERGAELTREVAKGVVASSGALSMAPEAAAEHAVQSAAAVMAGAGAPAGVAIQAAAQGAALGVAEAGADVGKAAGVVIEAARGAGETIGLTGDEAARQAAQGVVAAVSELRSTSSERDGPKPKDALPDQPLRVQPDTVY
jgi:MFS family permease